MLITASRRQSRSAARAAAAALAAFTAAAVAQAEPPAAQGGTPVSATNLSYSVPMPQTFTTCFFLGYVENHLPTNPATFDMLLTNLAANGYTTVHGTYADWRVEACRKRGLRFMIDMVDPAVDYRKTPEKAEALCRSLRGNEGVWGYAIWYAGGCGARLNPKIEKFREWDPTHPCFVGSKYCEGIEEVTLNPGVLAWEDLDWHEDNPRHFIDMMKMFQCNQKLGAQTGRWIVTAGREKDRYTMNQSIATGLKALMWFIGGPWDKKNEQWVPDHHFLELNREVRPLYADLMKLGHPLAVYSTPVTRSAANVEVRHAVPEPVPAIPEDFWLRVERGEALLGVYRYPDGTDAVYVANHNAFAPQAMVMRFRAGERALPAEVLDRGTGRWRALPTTADGAATFDLAPGGGELLRIVGRAAAR